MTTATPREKRDGCSNHRLEALPAELGCEKPAGPETHQNQSTDEPCDAGNRPDSRSGSLTQGACLQTAPVSLNPDQDHANARKQKRPEQRHPPTSVGVFARDHPPQHPGYQRPGGEEHSCIDPPLDPLRSHTGSGRPRKSGRLLTLARRHQGPQHPVQKHPQAVEEHQQHKSHPEPEHGQPQMRSDPARHSGYRLLGKVTLQLRGIVRDGWVRSHDPSRLTRRESPRHPAHRVSGLLKDNLRGSPDGRSPLQG